MELSGSTYTSISHIWEVYRWKFNSHMALTRTQHDKNRKSSVLLQKKRCFLPLNKERLQMEGAGSTYMRNISHIWEVYRWKFNSYTALTRTQNDKNRKSSVPLGFSLTHQTPDINIFQPFERCLYRRKFNSKMALNTRTQHDKNRKSNILLQKKTCFFLARNNPSGRRWNAAEVLMSEILATYSDEIINILMMCHLRRRVFTIRA